MKKEDSGCPSTTDQQHGGSNGSRGIKWLLPGRSVEVVFSVEKFSFSKFT